MNARRAEIAAYYQKNLSDLGLGLPRQPEGATTNWHLFYILTPPEEKYWVMDALRAEGVYANVHYTPLHRNRFYASLGTDDDFPGSMGVLRRSAAPAHLPRPHRRRA